jgi:VWFA-related protein
MRRATCLVLFVLVPVLPAVGRKQSRRPEQAPGVVQVTTHLVQVNVIVKDRHGQPVPGLTRDEFTITDDGKPREISGFLVEQSHTQAALPPVPPDFFTNITERQTGGAPAVTVILLDGLNTRWEDQARSTDQVIKFLRHIHPGDRVGLYTLGTRLEMLHDFTSDSAAMVQALAHYRGRAGNEVESSQADDTDNPPEWVDTAGDLSSGIPSQAVSNAIQDWLTEATNLEAKYYMDQRVKMTVDALVAIAEHLRGVPGRKNLIWVSSAFPLLRGMDRLMQGGDFSTGSEYQAEVSRASEALNDVNLAIYPVDARGLMVDPNFVVQGRPASYAAYRRMQRLRLPAHVADNFPTMDEFALRTGGRAFYNTNDIQGAIRQVIDGSRLTYLLAYYPTNTVWNGKFHKIKVKVDRPGLRLQYREGYSAVAEPPVTPRTAAQQLDAAVLSPLDATGMSLVVKATPGKPAGASRNVILQYWIDPRNITLSPEGKKWAVRVTLVLEQFGPRGTVLKGVSHNFDFDLNDAGRKTFLASGLRYNESLALVSNAERLRFVVRDDPTERIGSLSVPLDRVVAAHPPIRQ